MENNKNLGIWMDHSTAHLIDLDAKETHHTIKSKFSETVREQALNKNENLMHNKEQQMHEAYYKKIGAEMLKYDHVLLFGPTRAKTELYNYVEKDLHFKEIKIDIEPADKLSPNEKEAFVREHFTKNTNPIN